MFQKMTLGLAILLVSTAATAEKFKLSSATIKPKSKLEEAQVFNGFGCTGKNISPQLRWTPGPEGTKSYAITVYDPDAPTGSGWWHWLVYNIPASVTSLEQGAGKENSVSLPQGAVQGRSDFGTHAFGGACPPEGDKPHRYIFTIHALKTESIPAPEDASAAMIGFMLNANRLDEASFVTYYGR